MLFLTKHAVVVTAIFQKKKKKRKKILLQEHLKEQKWIGEGEIRNPAKVKGRGLGRNGALGIQSVTTANRKL